MSERKILTAKRHGFKPNPRTVNKPIPISTSNQGIKRNHDAEQAELPPSKKLNRNCFQSPTNSTQKTPKNIAQKRMQNLRNSLEAQRRVSEGLQSASSLSSPNIKSNSVIPISNRMRPKFEKNNLPSVSQIPNNISNFNLVNVSVPCKDEEMDWNEINDTTVVNDIIDLRKEINYHKELPSVPEVDNNVSLNSDGVFVVVDTNIFLSQLTMLSELKEKRFSEFGGVTIVVPWMVIQELDYMKESHSSKSIMKAARNAVHYINSQLANKDPHFTGQSVMDAAKSEISSSNPDDGIMFCCMQISEKGKFVILLSNDVNLRNKALIHKIQAYNSCDIITKLHDLKINDDILNPSKRMRKVEILLSNLLTHVIENEMKEAYGNVWQMMANIKPPFTTEESLNCIIKYWVAVFSFSLQKQCKLKVEEFIQFLKQHRNDASYHSKDFNKYVEHTLSLCIYFKNGYSKYKNIIADCIKSIQKCTET